MKIKSIKAREILDSRGVPTVEVDLVTNNGVFRASVPSGSSTGKHEAFELRDVKKKRYHGLGVEKAVKNINKVIAPKVKGINVIEQGKIDGLMIRLDGTENKSKLGANAILGVSMAVCRAGAAAKKMPLWKHISKLASVKPKLPAPCILLIEGGLHGRGDLLDIQEFMIVPQFRKFSKNLQASAEIYSVLKEILKKEYGSSGLNSGDEGGFAPPLKFAEQALNLILIAIKKAGHKDKVRIALDVAASSSKKKYSLDFYSEIIKKYPIISLEDPFSEEDWKGFQKITKKLGKKTIIFGDDLLVTNPKRIAEAQEKKACNGLLLKINQIGTITEALQAFNLAKCFGWKVMVSHRAGETEDSFISDLAVGIGADFIKAGAPVKGERVAKYNRLLRIEENFK